MLIDSISNRMKNDRSNSMKNSMNKSESNSILGSSYVSDSSFICVSTPEE